MNAETKAPEWTTLMVKMPTANKVRKLAFDRKRDRKPNASTRDTADELIRLGLESIRSAHGS